MAANPKPIRKAIKKSMSKNMDLIKKVSQNKSHEKGLSKLKNSGKSLKSDVKESVLKKMK